MNVPILFQDDYLLVINKPAGLVVNKAESVSETTLQDFVDTGFDWELAHDSEARNGIVHRLDKDTSGVMVLAKTSQVMTELQRQFHDRETEKTYLALVHGWFSAKEGSISVPMARSVYDRHKFVVSLGGRMTETGYAVLHEYAGLAEKGLDAKGYQGFSLVELHPKTGRTHQIRVIMTHLKHPLVGDGRYVGRKRAKADAKWCPRQFLHAQKLCFTHPVSGERQCVEAPLAGDVTQVLRKLLPRE